MPQERILLKNCGIIDPLDINTYLARGGFQAWGKARKMRPDEVIREIKTSGLKGRGGAGFPCGLKWELAASEPGGEKFLIANADEGEVGAFKDRYLLQHDPFSLFEGMIIAGHAVAARHAYLYLRAEYHFLLDGLRRSLGQVKEKGFSQGLEIEIREGAGAYICGEESALMDSIEGKRGEARCKPPFPTSKGLWDRPTVINNVETLANVPHIILHGSPWFRGMGTEQSKGTKLFSVSGDVKRPGVYELVMGSPLTELLDLAGAANIKMVQVGGASGGIIPYSMISTPLAYETVLGSGAVTVFNESRGVLDFILRTMEFLAEESCGKCAPCREGIGAMMEILERLSAGDGRQEDIQNLEDLSRTMGLSSLCGLGQTASLPVLDTLKYFRNDYETRVKQSIFLRSLQGLP